MHSILSPNYKRLRHREIVALHFHGLGMLWRAIGCIELLHHSDAKNSVLILV